VYKTELMPFTERPLAKDKILLVSDSGDHVFLSSSQLRRLKYRHETLPLKLQANLRAKFFLRSNNAFGTEWLLKSRIKEKAATVMNGPSLHIIVPTLQCAHSCKYCQVSRSLNDQTHVMSQDNLDAACDSIFQSENQFLTVEFQGGDPLIRFDMVEYAIRRIHERNKLERRQIRFVVATTMHQLTDVMCIFFKEFGVYLSTSIDGPAHLHNKNRPTPTRDAYEKTIAGINLAREFMGNDAVSALMTTTKSSLLYAEEIVDEYVKLGFSDIFIRPLSYYGFAKRNQRNLAYTVEEYMQFYAQALNRILYWNKQGLELREVYASILFNKMLSTYDGGYVDLQSPTGAGLATIVYNYDGYVYPSDEARMLVESGDLGLRLGRIGESLKNLLNQPIQKKLIEASLVDATAECSKCVYKKYCAPNPVDSYAQHGVVDALPYETEHCKRHMSLFDEMFRRVDAANEKELDIYFEWSHPVGGDGKECVE
jgi:His-Xaa-Ser system radical SAM maturase HxsB